MPHATRGCGSSRNVSALSRSYGGPSQHAAPGGSGARWLRWSGARPPHEPCIGLGTTSRSLFLALMSPLWSLALPQPANAASDGDDDEKPSTKVSVVPFAGGDTDNGIGIGALGALERTHPVLDPYAWRLELAGTATFKSAEEGEGGLTSPYHDVYLRLAWLAAPALELQFRASYTGESMLSYSGVGNASPAPVAANSPTGDDRYFSWSWRHPKLTFGARAAVLGPLHFLVRVAYTHNWFTIPDESKLRDDAEFGSETERDLVRGLTTHGLLSNDFALELDTRDDHVDPKTGHYHELSLRYAPEGAGVAPHHYGQGNLTLRFFVTPADPYVTLAVRTTADLLFGAPPFYELARADDTFAFGGAKAVRGVEKQRYYGKVKLFSNVELRSRLLPFRAFGKDCVLGAAVFADFGRLWADYDPRPELDGTGLGLKYGIGGGPRVLVGDVLLVRGDVAWSPDAHPVSGYFLANHAF